MSSRSVATKEVSDALLGALETGTTVAEEFIKKCIMDKSVDFYDSLSKNNLNTFKSMAAATQVKVNGQQEILKVDRNLFARLAVIGQTWSMDMCEVLSHAYDHYNYARYASLYWCQMKHLPESHPEAHTKMLQGEFAVQRSCGGFTLKAVDQTVEQIIKKQKARVA